jgi:hypothetical protein
MTQIQMTEMTIRQTINRDAATVADFRANVAGTRGIAYTIGWDATDAIVAEKRLAAAEALRNIAADGLSEWLDAVAEAADAIRENAVRDLGYFDPTVHGTSASQAYVARAEFKATQAVVKFLDEVAVAIRIDNGQADEVSA